MGKRVFLTFILLLTTMASVWAWDGLGTVTNPYHIRSINDWKQLSDEVLFGNSFSGKYFELTADIDASGVSVGTTDKAFSGTFSGGMHTLTYDKGTNFSYAEGDNAPFVLCDLRRLVLAPRPHSWRQERALSQ